MHVYDLATVHADPEDASTIATWHVDEGLKFPLERAHVVINGSTATISIPGGTRDLYRYETQPVLGADGNPREDEDGNVVTEQVAIYVRSEDRRALRVDRLTGVKHDGLDGEDVTLTGTSETLLQMGIDPAEAVVTYQITKAYETIAPGQSA